jgi:hypothetical protein
MQDHPDALTQGHHPASKGGAKTFQPREVILSPITDISILRRLIGNRRSKIGNALTHGAQVPYAQAYAEESCAGWGTARQDL